MVVGPEKGGPYRHSSPNSAWGVGLGPGVSDSEDQSKGSDWMWHIAYYGKYKHETTQQRLQLVPGTRFNTSSFGRKPKACWKSAPATIGQRACDTGFLLFGGGWGGGLGFARLFRGSRGFSPLNPYLSQEEAL